MHINIAGTFNKTNKKSKFICLSLFFSILVGLGLSLYKDFNISSDEVVERSNGIVSLLYIGDYLDLKWVKNNQQLNSEKNGNQPLEQYRDRDYPVGFNLPAIILERLLKIEGEQKIYNFRHFLNFLVCLLGVFAVYRLSERRFSDWRIGLLSALFYMLSPRLFAESFYNSKDPVFMAFFAIAMNALIAFVMRPKISLAMLCALASAFTINIRIMGILIPFVTIAVLMIEILKAKITWQRGLSLCTIYFCTLVCFTIVFWPWLWSAPIERFLEALKNMTHFRWDGEMLYLGALIRSTQLPWHYLPVWILITTPPIYLLLWLIGISGIANNLYQSRGKLWANAKELQDNIFLAFFLGPILAVIILHSVLYDSWRQLYFIYPAFILIATKGWVIFLQKFAKNQIIKIVFYFILMLSLGLNLIWMIKSHPLQNVYFNIFAGKDWKSNFDVDYWGLSNAKALQYILKHDNRNKILVYSGSFTPLELAFKRISLEDQKRIIQTSWIADADYIITNYRLSSLQYDEPGSHFNLFHNILIDNEIILSIYRADKSAGNNLARFTYEKWREINNQVLQYILDVDNRMYIRAIPGDDFSKTLLFKNQIEANKKDGRIINLSLRGPAEYIIYDYRVSPKNTPLIIDGYTLIKEFSNSYEVVARLYKNNNSLSTLSPIKIGQKINFSRSGSGMQYLMGLIDVETYLSGWGWRYPEGWGVWSNGDKAKLLLPIPIGDVNNLTLSARALVSKKHPSQKINIMVNGIFIKQITLNKSDENQILIPVTPAFKKQGFLNIEFKFLNPTRPSAIGIGEDDGLITLGLISAEFK